MLNTLPIPRPVDLSLRWLPAPLPPRFAQATIRGFSDPLSAQSASSDDDRDPQDTAAKVSGGRPKLAGLGLGACLLSGQ
jgi:hypothetical protein